VAVIRHGQVHEVLPMDRAMYGVCVINYEPIHIVPFMPDNPSYQWDMPDINKVVFTPRCYCILTFHTPFQHMLSLLYALIERQRMIVQFRLGLLSERKYSVTQLHTFLCAAADTRMPHLDEPLTIQIKDTYEPFCVETPPMDDAAHMAAYALRISLSLLDIRSIMKLVGLVLMGASLVVRSDSLGVASAMVYSIIVIMRPYAFSGPVIPVVPYGVTNDIFQSPGQKMVATHVSMDHLARDCSCDTVRLDLDGDTVNCVVPKMYGCSWSMPYLKRKLLDPLKSFMSNKRFKYMTDADFLGITNVFRSYHCYLAFRMAQNCSLPFPTGITSIADLCLIKHWMDKHNATGECNFMSYFLGGEHMCTMVNTFVILVRTIHTEETMTALCSRKLFHHCYDCVHSIMFKFEPMGGNLESLRPKLLRHNKR